MDVNSLPKTVTRQHRDCDLNPGPSAPESSMLTTRLPSHPKCPAAEWLSKSYKQWFYQITCHDRSLTGRRERGVRSEWLVGGSTAAGWSLLSTGALLYVCSSQRSETRRTVSLSVLSAGERSVSPLSLFTIRYDTRCYFNVRPNASVKSRLILPFWYRLTRVVPEKGPLNRCKRV